MDCHDENVDLAEIEANLYAKIHHDAPETVEQYTAAALLQQDLHASRVVTKQTVVNKAGTQSTNSQNGRYWGDEKHQPRSKVSSNKVRLNPFSVANQQGRQQNASPPQPIVQADYRPKPFSPYTSFIGSIVNEASSSNLIPTSEAATDPGLKTQRKNMLNPFNRLNENKLKRKVKFTVKKERATKAKAKKHCVETINLDTSEEEDEDDDVICIPVPPPPLVCIESTDDEEGNDDLDLKQQTNCDDNAIIPEDFIGQRDRSRMSQSIETDALGGIDDDELSFIRDTVENDVDWHERETFVTSKEITENCSPVPVNSSAELERYSTVCEDDSVVFVTPQKTALSNTGKPTYEVSENGFAAVDVYESESSDFPESVYAKGALRAGPEIRPIHASDSDCSDIQINTHNRSKRMLKRKSSGSNKGSDYKTDDGDESDDGVPFLDICKDTSTPYLQRGEAVNNAKLDKYKQKASTRRKLAEEKSVSSDDEFLSMLSCIVHDNPDKDVDLNSTEDDPSSNKTDEESSSIDARQVVEHVLMKIAKSAVPQETEDENWMVTDEVVASDVEDENSATNKEADLPVDAAIKEGKSSLSWIVKDQIGETDNFVEDLVPTIVKPLTTAAEIVKTTTDNVSINTAGPSEPNKPEKTDNQCVRSCSLAVDPEIGWNDEMKRFYNDTWGGESFNVTSIQREMPSRRSYEWETLPDDHYVQRRNNRNRNLRCMNCREEGHRMHECYMPPRQIKCHMCGQIGHREPRCPQTMCLRCGNANSVFSRGCNRCHYMQNVVCPICKTRGHGIRECSDKWRRYHSTIDPSQPLKKLPMLINKPRFCCICAGKGHSAEYCRNALRILDTPMPPIHIYSYVDVYDPINHESSEDRQEEPPRFVLMSAPVENSQFSWDVDESPNRFYGRIMTAINITREPVFEPKNKRRNENSVQMVINPMSTINQDLNKRNKKLTTNFYEDKSSLPNSDTQNAPEATVVLAVQDTEESYGENGQRNKHKRFTENCQQNNMEVKSIITSYSRPVEVSTPTSSGPPAFKSSLCDVPSDPIIAKKVPEATVEDTDKHAEINHRPEQADEDDHQDKRVQSEDPEQVNKSLENCFSFTKTLNDSYVHKPNKFDLNHILGNYSNSGDVSSPLFNASNDWINSNFLNMSEQSLYVSNGKADQVTMGTTLNTVRNIAEAASSINQRHSTPNKEQHAERITIKGKSLSNIDVDRLSIPQAPSPPSMFCESDKIADEVRRLDISQMFLDNLKHQLISNNEDGAFVISLNEDVEEVAQKSKRMRLDSDSNYSFSEYFEGDHHSDELNDSAKESTSIDDTGSNLDFIPLNNGSEEIVEDGSEEIVEDNDNNISTEIRHMAAPSGSTNVYLTEDNWKCLKTRLGNEFLVRACSKNSVVVRMEFGDYGNTLLLVGSTLAQHKFHLDLRAYFEAAEKAAHLKRLTSQKLPKNRFLLIKFIKEEISKLENSHGNVKELYLRMCMHQKKNNKTSNRNADRIRRLLNMILMGQTGLREGPLHLRSLQSNLKSLLIMKKIEVANNMREEVLKHYQYIFSAVEHSDYPGLLREYEAIRKQKYRPVMKIDRSLLGLKIDVTFPATAEAASCSHETTNDFDESKPVVLMNKFVEGHNIKTPIALLEAAVKRMKKNDAQN